MIDDIVKEALDVVADINDEIIYYKNENSEAALEYYSNGFASIIKFLNFVIWSSEEDTRKWIEKDNSYEPLYDFIKQKYNQIIKDLQTQLL